MVQVERHRYAIDGWGTGELFVRGRVLFAHEFSVTPGAAPADAAPTSVPTPPKGAQRPPVETLSADRERECDSFVASLARRVRRFLDGYPEPLDDVQIDLSWCTPFQAALTRELRRVPRGEVVTYGELSALAGRPGAARAAGTFCAGNRYPIVLPCHRVVSAAGIGGYGSAGVELKRRLLRLEGVEL